MSSVPTLYPKREAIVAVAGSGLTSHLTARVREYYEAGKRVCIIDDGRFHPNYHNMGFPIVPVTVENIETRQQLVHSINPQAIVEAYDFSHVRDQPDRHASIFGCLMTDLASRGKCDVLIIVDTWQYVWKGINIDAWLTQFTGHLIMTFRRPSHIAKCGITLKQLDAVTFHKISPRSLATLAINFPTIPETAVSLIAQTEYTPGAEDRIEVVVWDTRRRVTKEVVRARREQLWDSVQDVQ